MRLACQIFPQSNSVESGAEKQRHGHRITVEPRSAVVSSLCEQQDARVGLLLKREIRSVGHRVDRQSGFEVQETLFDAGQLGHISTSPVSPATV